MGYPYVQAANDYGPRKGPARAFVIHMAEGGGTVGYLSRPNPRGVSVHYVIERSGRIVQMLAEGRASGSINPRDIRTTDDADGLYGVTDARLVLGSWWRDPNSASLTVEVEGYAKAGPNAAQDDALAALVTDVRSRYPTIGLLGHRDFTLRKACPGQRIEWDRLGGHGRYDPPELVTYRLHVAPGARVRQYLHLTAGGRIDMRPMPDGSPAFRDTVWGRTASAAPSGPILNRGVVNPDHPSDSLYTVRTAKVDAGRFAGHVVRVGAPYGVTVEVEG